MGTQIISSLPNIEHIVVILFSGSSWTKIYHPLNNMILFSYPDWLPMVAIDILHLTIKNREASVPTQFIRQDFIKNTLRN